MQTPQAKILKGITHFLDRNKIPYMMNGTNKLLLIFLTGIAFGSAVVTSRLALKEVSPFTLVVFRFGIAAIFYFVTLFLLKKKLPPFSLRKYFDIFIVGLSAFGLPLFIFFFALLYISSGMFSVLFATLPILTAILANIFLRNEKVNRRVMLGLVIALSGVVLLFVTRTNGLGSVYDVKGPLIALVGVAVAAFGAVYTRLRLSGEDAMVISALQTVVAFGILAALIFLLGKFSIGHISNMGWFAIFYNSIVGSYIAFWLNFTLIKKYGATASSLVSFVMPFVSSVLGVIFLGEIITLPLVIGGLVILVGLFFASR